MQYSLSSILSNDNGEYELGLEVKNIDSDDYRCDLLSELLMPAIETVVEYVETMPANNEYKRDEDGQLSSKDMKACIEEFNANHLNKFIDLLKNNIRDCGHYK